MAGFELFLVNFNEWWMAQLWFQSTRSPSSGMGISNGYSGIVGKLDNQTRIEAKYPALLFKQQLTAYVEKIYGMIRDSLKKEISPFLAMCIQVCMLTKYIY